MLYLYADYQRNGSQHRRPLLSFIRQIGIVHNLLFLKMDNRRNPNLKPIVNLYHWLPKFVSSPVLCKSAEICLYQSLMNNSFVNRETKWREISK